MNATLVYIGFSFFGQQVLELRIGHKGHLQRQAQHLNRKRSSLVAKGLFHQEIIEKISLSFITVKISIDISDLRKLSLKISISRLWLINRVKYLKVRNLNDQPLKNFLNVNWIRRFLHKQEIRYIKIGYSQLDPRIAKPWVARVTPILRITDLDKLNMVKLSWGF